MYKNIYTEKINDNNEYFIHLWDDNGYTKDFWQHKVYRRCLPENATHKGLNGEDLIKVSNWNSKEEDLHFHDMKPYQTYLIEKYLTNDEVSTTHKEIYFDIEIEMGESLSPHYIKKAPKKVTSIAYYYKQKNEWVILILDTKGELEYKKEDNREIIPCLSESQLLENFITLFRLISPNILIGWNSDYFDIPYLYYRICNVLGEEKANSLSPIGIVEETPYTDKKYIDIAGIESLDYMRLCMRYFMKDESSWSLNNIGTKYINLGKIEYKGNLDDLFRDDIDKFIEYNFIDVKIIVELEKKFDFIEVVKTLSHKGKIKYSEIYSNTILQDGAISSYLLSNNIIPPSKDRENVKIEDYAGGFNFTPNAGIFDNLFDLDLVSLYPSIIMSLNVGPETYVSRIILSDTRLDTFSLSDLKRLNSEVPLTIETNTREIYNIKVKEFIKYIEDNNFTISANGTVFDTKKQSVLSYILSQWFNERVEYKNKMKEYSKSGNEEMKAKYFRLQYTMKILLNSLYGATSLPSFRYGNVYIAIAITLTGQRIIKESAYYVNNEINKELVK